MTLRRSLKHLKMAFLGSLRGCYLWPSGKGGRAEVPPHRILVWIWKGVLRGRTCSLACLPRNRAWPAEGDLQVSWASTGSVVVQGLPFGRFPWKGRNEPGGGATAAAALRRERPPGWLPLFPPTSLYCKRLSQRRMELLEEDLTCPICCGLFDDPRALPCSHNFCRKCLEGILEGNIRNVIWRPPFKCPTCRKETTVTGVNNLQVNYSLKGIVEKYNKIKISTKMPVCKVHSGQPLNIFCQTDTQLICGICATRGDHIKHLFCSIEDAYCQEKRAFETLSQVFEAWHCGDALSRLGTLETSKRKALQMLTKDYDRVKDFFEKLQYTLEQKKNEILSDFETMKLAVMQAYDPEINKLNTIIQEQQTAFNIAETFKDVSEPILFLQQMQEFREKIKVIKETRLPCVTVDIKSTIKDVDTNQWEQFKLADVDKLSLPQEKSSFNWVTNSFLSPRFFVTALICLLVVVTQVCVTDFWGKTFQYWKTLVSAFGTGYLTDPTEMADHAILYWEKVADSAAVLSEKCVNYIHVLLNNVAQFVYMYKLL